MLQTSRVHPKISAYHCLEGIHDFNRVPWAPPGTRAEGRTPRGASAASMLTSLPPPPVPLFLWGRALYTAAPSAACFSSRSGWRPAGTGDWAAAPRRPSRGGRPRAPDLGSAEAVRQGMMTLRRRVRPSPRRPSLSFSGLGRCPRRRPVRRAPRAAPGGTRRGRGIGGGAADHGRRKDAAGDIDGVHVDVPPPRRPSFSLSGAGRCTRRRPAWRAPRAAPCGARRGWAAAPRTSAEGKTPRGDVGEQAAAPSLGAAWRRAGAVAAQQGGAAGQAALR